MPQAILWVVQCRIVGHVNTVCMLVLRDFFHPSGFIPGLGPRKSGPDTFLPEEISESSHCFSRVVGVIVGACQKKGASTALCSLSAEVCCGACVIPDDADEPGPLV